jgi:hypothetical protein
VHRTLSGDSPDSPVNYSGVPSEFPEGEEFSLECPGAPDTVRWHTGQSGAPVERKMCPWAISTYFGDLVSEHKCISVKWWTRYKSSIKVCFSDLVHCFRD